MKIRRFRCRPQEGFFSRPLRPGRPAFPRPRRLRLEPLEERTLLDTAGPSDDLYTLPVGVLVEPQLDGADIPCNADGQHLEPSEYPGVVLGVSYADLASGGRSAASWGEVPDTELLPVKYDIDDDGRIGFGDLAFFAEAFQRTVGDPGAPFAWASDFDHSGRVDVGDLAFFAENFQRAPGDPIVYPGDFPDAWQVGSLGLQASTPFVALSEPTITGLGVAGDSLSDEYAGESYAYARNWVELLAEQRQVNVGPVGSWPEPRREGYEYNWARSGATSQTLLDEGQHTGLAGQADAGLVSHAIVAVGPNDFFDGGFGGAYLAIYAQWWSPSQIDDFVDGVVGNIETAVDTLTSAGVSLVLSNVIDYGVAPMVRELFSDADRRDLVTQVVADVNSRVASLAYRYGVPLVDTCGLARQLLGTNHAPAATVTVGGVEITNASGEDPHYAFVHDKIHPHTVAQALFANLFLEGLHLGYSVDVGRFTEEDIVTLVGLPYTGDTLDLSYADFVVLPAATARLDLSLVCEPTAVDALTGEVDTLPTSEAWIDEWTSCQVEIWAETPGVEAVGIAAASFDLAYDTDLLTAASVEHGPAFTQDPAGSIDDAAGRVHVSATTPRTDAGDDRHVLLARVWFEPSADDPGCPHNAQAQYITPLDDLGLELLSVSVSLVGTGPAPADLGDSPETAMWPVMYDIDDDGRVAFGDLAFFATAFQQHVGDPGADFAWASDFDRSGRVDFGDLAFFAANFGLSKTDGVALVYPVNFPDAWQTGGVGSPLALRRTATDEVMASLDASTFLRDVPPI